MRVKGKGVKRRGTILLIEDEEIVSRVTVEILTNQGYRVLTADNGIEAIQAYEKECKSIDLILLDLYLPRLNGAETFRRLKGLDPNAKIIVSTAGGADDSLLDQLDLQQNGYLRKPYMPRELTAEIDRVLSIR